MLGIAERLAQIGGSAGTGLGGALGGVLGGVGDILSAPRRGLMNFLGLPEDGSEMVSNLTGLDKEGMAAKGLGFLAEMATDPLTYAGGLFGRLGGRAAGALAGGNLEARALSRGPGFAGGLEKLASAEAGLAGAKELPAFKLLDKVKSSPLADRIMQEIEPGSHYLPGGNNALVFRTPTGDITRIGTEVRPALPEMLQPTRSVRLGDLNVERLPYAARVGDKDVWKAAYSPMSDSIRQAGFHPSDLHPGNVGMVGRSPLLIDPGAIAARPGGLPLPVGPQIQGTQRNNSLSDWILNSMGADQTLQDAINRKAGVSILDRHVGDYLGRTIGSP